LLSKTDLINFDLFLDSLAIASIFIKFSEKYDEVEKVLCNENLDFVFNRENEPIQRIIKKSEEVWSNIVN
jgi:hypothetical protein